MTTLPSPLLLFLCTVVLVSGASITVDWGDVVYVSKTSTTLQVVVNPYVQRGSPIHNGTYPDYRLIEARFEALAKLQADYVRFVPWLPYPQLGVAELQPPTGNPVCASIATNQILYLGCNEGVFKSFEFASYGTPDGRCGEFSIGKCDCNISQAIVEKFCLYKPSCQINVTSELFGCSCPDAEPRLAVQGTCSSATNQTFWNFTLLDPLMEDFMNATKNHSVIINFSTTPQWMWNTPLPIQYPADPEQVFWSYEQGTDLRDNSLQDLSDYYQRLVGWYTNGGFYDEYAVYHGSGHHYNIPIWEVLNEVEAEHQMTPKTYTRIYDAIVGGILKVQPDMEFVGLALAFREPSWIAYFLNASNHLPGVPVDWISYHFYASCGSRANVTEFETFFAQADGFFTEVTNIQAIRAQLAPSVKTTIDEIGVILPNDNVPNPSPIADLYWNAAGAMYAYIFGNLISQGIEVLGESQLVGYPTQFPSVSMMDWTNANPNSRYWVLFLLHENFHAGDKLVATKSDNSTVYAQGFMTPTGQKILVINKTQQSIVVTLQGVTGGTVTYVDNTTYDHPPASLALSQDTFTLNAFAVAVVVPSSPSSSL